MKHRHTLILVAVAVLVLAAAPAALAVGSSVRVQGAHYQVLGTTGVDESAGGGTIVDTKGTSYVTTTATALGAAAVALHEGGSTWDMTVSGFGPFVNSIAGLTSNPVDYSDWWQIVVNGYSAPVGAGSLETVAGDSYLWFQNPDATFSRSASLLVTRVSGGTSGYGFTPGQTVALTTVADDLAKVDSQADATRFSATSIQTPGEFPALSGATLHVGGRVYNDAASTVTVSDLAPGTYAVWSEKAMDATMVYATSGRTLINVGANPSLSALTAKRSRTSKTVIVQFTLDKDAALTITGTRGSKNVLTYSGTGIAGAQKLTLRLSSPAPKKTSFIRLKITAQDQWGRSAAKRIKIARGH